MFGPKFTDIQLEAMAKSIVDFDRFGDEAISRFLDPEENIPLTPEFTPISFFDRKKKKKAVIRDTFNMGVLRGFAWYFSDHDNYNVDDKYIEKLIKQSLKKSELLRLESSVIYKRYINANRDENWGKGVFFAKTFLIEYMGVSEELLNH